MKDILFCDLTLYGLTIRSHIPEDDDFIFKQRKLLRVIVHKHMPREPLTLITVENEVWTDFNIKPSARQLLWPVSDTSSLLSD